MRALGCMRLSTAADREDARSAAVLAAALTHGVELLETADALPRRARGRAQRAIDRRGDRGGGDRARAHRARDERRAGPARGCVGAGWARETSRGGGAREPRSPRRGGDRSISAPRDRSAHAAGDQRARPRAAARCRRGARDRAVERQRAAARAGARDHGDRRDRDRAVAVAARTRCTAACSRRARRAAFACSHIGRSAGRRACGASSATRSSRRSRLGSAHRRRRSRWPGCARWGRTSCRCRARRASRPRAMRCGSSSSMTTRALAGCAVPRRRRADASGADARDGRRARRDRVDRRHAGRRQVDAGAAVRGARLPRASIATIVAARCASWPPSSRASRRRARASCSTTRTRRAPREPP